MLNDLVHAKPWQCMCARALSLSLSVYRKDLNTHIERAWPDKVQALLYCKVGLLDFQNVHKNISFCSFSGACVLSLCVYYDLYGEFSEFFPVF
jgi:hypothetical protein